jgi:tRNA dimethylallyltransferase
MTRPAMPVIIALVGPTASGKTSLAEELAGVLPVEIISADSRQIYRHLTIGTAKPSASLIQDIPHHFVDIIDPDETYSAGRFGTEATAAVWDIIARDKVPLVVGGSGLYVQALCEGFFRDENAGDVPAHRQQLKTRLQTEGIDVLYDELTRVDPASAARYNDRNPRRILRALEYFHATGQAFSSAHTALHEQREFRTLYFAPKHDREELYRRINTRTEQMFAGGIIEETEAVLAMGYAPELNSLNTVGYKECIAFLRGDLSREDALRLTQQNTRRYAKRQLTWFRRNDTIHWFDESPKNFAKNIKNQYISVSGLAV